MIRYYPFELHCHTRHSDGGFTPELLADFMAKDGFCGFALTDHNTVSGIQDAKTAADEKGLVFIPGIEWTTFYGHITVLGGIPTQTFYSLNPKTVTAAAKKTAAEGLLCGIAHPFRIGYPVCTGGSDDWGVTDYSVFTHYEVWSYLSPGTDATNACAERRYEHLCSSGARLAAVYGRDYHEPDKKELPYAKTYLGIDGAINTENAVSAIRARRTFVSTGVIAALSVSGEDGDFGFGSVIRKGKYSVRLITEYDCPNYVKKFEVIGERVTLYGSALSEPMEFRFGEVAEFAMNLLPGELFLKVYGTIRGESAALLYATPLFIEN